ncbi:uncharacterized protein LOC127749354 [Frankliniella occidentalis]|uniref:Uncharacterized protein LOC127749354 n=1 Tax=Frankliniella occidentalis TaxID=133901 RepID=A0A9C6U430_FRAOC|nr:uncharacterized protein LOC127749354 [Frankliniella occidentalis]
MAAPTSLAVLLVAALAVSVHAAGTDPMRTKGRQEPSAPTSSPAPPAATTPSAPAAPAAAAAVASSGPSAPTSSGGPSGGEEPPSGLSAPDGDCDPDNIGFELITGYVFSAPNDLLDSLPGTLMLTDCLEACQGNDSCQAVNYETGLCVLFSSNADTYPGALSRSQFPVFTIYAQKSCLGVKPCERAWCFDRVQGYQLSGFTRKQTPAASRQECLELCLGEREFPCR